MINVLRFKGEIPTFVDLYENQEYRGTIQSIYHLNDIRIQLAEHFKNGNPQTGWSFRVLPDEKYYTIEPNGDIGNWPPDFFDLEIKQMAYRSLLNNKVSLAHQESRKVLETWYIDYISHHCSSDTTPTPKTLTLKNVTVSSEVFRNIIITAFEGDIYYWVYFYMEDLNTNLEGTGSYIFEALADRLYIDPNFSLTIYDAENRDKELGNLTQGKIIDALNLLQQDDRYVSRFNRILSGELDVEDADILIQFAVLGEHKFG